MKGGKMKSLVYVLSFIVLVAMSTISFAGEFKLYKGAKMDNKATQKARQIVVGTKVGKGAQTTIYTTGDSFEKVFHFYNGIAKEYKMPWMGGKAKTLPSGQEIKDAFFIFDGAPDITTSKLWIKIQRPYIGAVKMEGYIPKYEDIQEITCISVYEQK
jgi:hypothetical protein